ncbi:polysaccharide biosynthesis C-terminal domain-containing protein [Dokdonia sp. R86516]|uniref:oligosaccharide flippase family protein n=1 Tax=Dokdonia sp. R86516 TaxID=3093856 RepID=UPI0037C8316F
MLLKLFKKTLKNKLIIYLGSRYATYFVQFITSLIIASKLGPTSFGVWGVILLLLNYFRIVNFGVANAYNIFAIQNKSDEIKVKKVTASSLLILTFLSIVIVFIALYHHFIGFEYILKYDLGNLFYYTCIAAILTHFNTLFMNIYRIKNRLFEIGLYQSVIPLILFIVALFSNSDKLLEFLTLSYVAGNIIALIIFIFNGKIPFGEYPSLEWVRKIIDKGIYLFIYNLCFYFILLSIRTLISLEYTVTEFGFFSFSFALANAILMFLQALTFIVFPKVIDKFNTTDKVYVSTLISNIRDSYVAFSFGLVFVAIIFFPVLIYFVPKYAEGLLSLQLIALTIILYTQSFGYNTYLMAQNKERTIAKIALFSLSINLGMACMLIYGFNVAYDKVIIATLVSYFMFAYLAMFFAKKELGLKNSPFSNLKEIFPLRLLVPYVAALIIIFLELNFFLPIPLILFIILNKNKLKGVILKLKTIFTKPDIINLD